MPFDPAKQEEERENRKVTFDASAEVYDRIRPTYPQVVFDDLVELTQVPEGGRVLEIGFGTGQATRPTAERGYEIVGVELGAGLAEVARRSFESFPNVEIHVEAFENWPLPKQHFNVVMAATAFHWLDPKTRFQKCADALTLSGALAVIGTRHVAGGTEAFFVETQKYYRQYQTGSVYDKELPKETDVTTDVHGLKESGLFTEPQMRQHPFEVTYTSDEYLDLLCTYSDHHGYHRIRGVSCSKPLGG